MNVDDFVITECDKENLIQLCSVKNNKNESFFIAERIFTYKQTGEICESEWVIHENKGEPSCCAKIFEASCKDKRYIMKMVRKKSQEPEDVFKKRVFREIEVQNYIYKTTGLTIPIYQVFVNNDTIAMILPIKRKIKRNN